MYFSAVPAYTQPSLHAFCGSRNGFGWYSAAIVTEPLRVPADDGVGRTVSCVRSRNAFRRAVAGW